MNAPTTEAPVAVTEIMLHLRRRSAAVSSGLQALDRISETAFCDALLEWRAAIRCAEASTAAIDALHLALERAAADAAVERRQRASLAS